MTRYDPGDIVLMRFPFSDLSTSKQRPALVLSSRRFAARQGDVVVLAMTSQPSTEAKLRLAQWRSSGLPKPTCLKPVIGTLAATLVLRRLGKLHPDDHPCVGHALRLLIHADFFG